MASREFDYTSRCRVLRQVASGGMGKVYLAEQLGSAGFNKTVAIKTIRKDLMANERFLKLFIGEAKLVADLIHENILQVYQFEQRGSVYFIVMEYVHGRNLAQVCERLWAKEQTLDVEFGAFIMSRVARALSYAHTKRDRHGAPLDIVHRDVSPGNVIASFQGVVKLSDFGIAKALTTESPDETRVVLGKLGYLSPEQARFQATDARSDVFSLGLVMYEALTGQRPYQARTADELIVMHRDQPVTPPREINPEVPAALEQVLMRCLEQDPEKRFETAGDLVYALEYYMYHNRYGPTNEKLAAYICDRFPEEDPNAIV